MRYERRAGYPPLSAAEATLSLSLSLLFPSFPSLPLSLCAARSSLRPRLVMSDDLSSLNLTIPNGDCARLSEKTRGSDVTVDRSKRQNVSD